MKMEDNLKKKLSLNGDLCLAVRCMLLSNLNETSLFTGCMGYVFYVYTNAIYMGCCNLFFCLHWKDVSFKMPHHVLS